MIVELWNDVEMNVENSLVRAFSVVLQDIEGLGTRGGQHGAADARQNAPDGCGRFIRKLIEGCCGFFWYHQSVASADRVDVQERQNVLVLVYSMAGNGP